VFTYNNGWEGGVGENQGPRWTIRTKILKWRKKDYIYLEVQRHWIKTGNLKPKGGIKKGSMLLRGGRRHEK